MSPPVMPPTCTLMEGPPVISPLISSSVGRVIWLTAWAGSAAARTTAPSVRSSPLTSA